MLRQLTNAGVPFVLIGGIAGVAHGSRRDTGGLDVCYEATPDVVATLAALLAEWQASPRGVEPGLPFFMDERQFRVQPTMTLTTREGDFSVLTVVDGVGEYAKAGDNTSRCATNRGLTPPARLPVD